MAKTNDHSQRAHAILAASAAHRWLECPAAPIAEAKYPSETTVFAQEGTTAHEVAELVASGKTVDPSGEITEEMIRHAEGYRAYIMEQLRSSDASVLLEQRVDFSEWVPGGFGTCDCVILQDTTLTIIDYKYGAGVAVSAERNPQMMLYALGAIHEYGFVYDVEHLEMHIYQPRMDNISVFKMDLIDLLDWASNVVKPTAEEALSGKGAYHAGEHCRFCRHAGECRELARASSDKVKIGRKSYDVTNLADWEVADILASEAMISSWLRKVKEMATTKLLNGETIPGYKVVEGKMGNRKWTDELAVAKVLEENGVQKEDFTTVKLKSPAEMDKALGKKRAQEILSGLTERTPGSPTIVPEKDKREAITSLEMARKDFE